MTDTRLAGSPRITIITPSLNRGRFLEQAICSVLDQGYENLEYFVADGGSSDDSVSTIRLYESELAEAILGDFASAGEAVNAALAQATGEIVGVLPADDLLLPGALDVAAGWFRAAGWSLAAPRWAVGASILIGENDAMRGRVDPSLPPSLSAFLGHDAGLLPLTGTFWRRELLAEHGPFDAAMTSAFDYEYACRLLAAGETPALLGETLVAHRERDGCADAARVLSRGVEHIAAARRHAAALRPDERVELRRNCDLRERIYALADAEAHGPAGRRRLLTGVARHPWWAADANLRRALRFGVPARVSPVEAA